MEQNMKNTMENAKTLAGAVHDIAHAVAYPMVGEVIKTQSQLTERVSELEDDMSSAEGNMKNLMQMTDKALESIRADLHSATVEMNNPDDERIADLEAKIDQEVNDMNDRMLRLEEQITTIIGHFAKMGQLD